MSLNDIGFVWQVEQRSLLCLTHFLPIWKQKSKVLWFFVMKKEHIGKRWAGTLTLEIIIHWSWKYYWCWINYNTSIHLSGFPCIFVLYFIWACSVWFLWSSPNFASNIKRIKFYSPWNHQKTIAHVLPITFSALLKVFQHFFCIYRPNLLHFVIRHLY